MVLKIQTWPAHFAQPIVCSRIAHKDTENMMSSHTGHHHAPQINHSSMCTLLAYTWHLSPESVRLADSSM